jgi:hypothetical protein
VQAIDQTIFPEVLGKISVLLPEANSRGPVPDLDKERPSASPCVRLLQNPHTLTTATKFTEGLYRDYTECVITSYVRKVYDSIKNLIHHITGRPLYFEP